MPRAIVQNPLPGFRTPAGPSIVVVPDDIWDIKAQKSEIMTSEEEQKHEVDNRVQARNKAKKEEHTLEQPEIEDAQVLLTYQQTMARMQMNPDFQG
jgi:hypothetical protein